MRLLIDFESRSRCDLKKAGAWRYAADPSTSVLCLAVKVDNDLPWVWHPEVFPVERDAQWISAEAIQELVAKADEIEAHNAEFERAIWHHVLHLRAGWPDLPAHKLRCSAARAAMCSLPRALGDAAAVLGLGQRKDYAGASIMMKMCKPVKTRKKVNGEWTVTEHWHDDPADFQKLLNYCSQDVNTEDALSRALPQLSAYEQRVWHLDQTINARGIRIDRAAVVAMMAEIDKAEKRLLAEWVKTTGGVVSSPRQVEKTLAYFKTEFGADIDSLAKQDVTNAINELDELDEDPETPDSWLEIGKRDPRFRRLLEIRQQLSKASAKKFAAILARAGADDRIRSLLMYHGAGTGRWTGKGFQPQNLPSRGLAVDADDVAAHLQMAKDGVLESMVDDTLACASACIRGCLIASEGHRLVSADYSAIEGRVLAWLAGEEHVLAAYREGKRLYCVAAAGIYKKPYEEINEGRKHDPVYKKMDAVGKVIELACGYQGGIGAFKNMAKNYGMYVPDQEAKEAITAWRDSRPFTTKLWKSLEKAAIEAVMSPGTMVDYCGIRFKMIGKFLLMRLPSNRLLYYFDAHIEQKVMPWCDDDGNPVIKDCVAFWGVDSKTKRWQMQFGYGGLWTENAVQAIARDLMAEAMLNVEAAGYPVILTVHDELLCDVPVGHGSVEEFEKLMCKLPAWADGLPVSAEGWEGPRYKK